MTDLCFWPATRLVDALRTKEISSREATEAFLAQIDRVNPRVNAVVTLVADHVPDADDLVIERLRAAGVVTMGKTNTPEFAAGSHTFNPVFGHTHNPYALDRSAGAAPEARLRRWRPAWRRWLMATTWVDL